MPPASKDTIDAAQAAADAACLAAQGGTRVKDRGLLDEVLVILRDMRESLAASTAALQSIQSKLESKK